MPRANVVRSTAEKNLAVHVESVKDLNILKLKYNPQIFLFFTVNLWSHETNVIFLS